MGTSKRAIGAVVRVILTPQVPMVNGDTVIAAPRAGELDAEGDLHIAVAATTDPATAPAGTSYLVREEITKQLPLEYYVQIPHDELRTPDCDAEPRGAPVDRGLAGAGSRP